jgi:hypothetical protein
MGAAAANGRATANGASTHRKQPSSPPCERSGRGPVASAVLLTLILLTPAAILALGLACGDPSNPVATRARLALGPATYPRLCGAIVAAAPDLAPASATLAKWAGDGVARAREVLAARGEAATTTTKKAPTCQLSGTVDAECCESRPLRLPPSLSLSPAPISDFFQHNALTTHPKHTRPSRPL